MGSTPLVILLALLVLAVCLYFVFRPVRPRVAILNGAQLDFVPDGSTMYDIFRSDDPPFHNALYDSVRPVTQIDNVTCETIHATCVTLYNDGVRIFTGMLESKLLLALADFAKEHTDALILSASSSVPRAGVFPKNVFRLYPNDRDLYYEVRKVVADRFGTGVNRAVLVNGSPGNVWADAVQMVLYSMKRGTEGEEAGAFTVTETMTGAEQAGTPDANTVYIYAGDKGNFTLAGDFTTPANILVVSGTGWTFEVTQEDNSYAAKTVYSMDMVNSTKIMYAAMLRLHTTSIWPGYLLQAMHLATELDSKWDGRSSLVDLCEAMYGLGGHRVFNADHDGIADGAFTNVVTGTCESCLWSISWPSIPPITEAFTYVEEAFDEAVSVMSAILDTPITCGTQLAACSLAVADRNPGGMIDACHPLLNPTASGAPCISLATGISSACLHDMTLCAQGNHDACLNSTATCTVSMMKNSAVYYANYLLPLV